MESIGSGDDGWGRGYGLGHGGMEAMDNGIVRHGEQRNPHLLPTAFTLSDSLVLALGKLLYSRAGVLPPRTSLASPIPPLGLATHSSP